jgi:predicted dehydrogenase
MNRRTFVSSLAVAGAAAATSARLFRAAPAKRPTVGLIGCGWFGGLNLQSLMQHAGVEVISLCDVNTRALQMTLSEVAKSQQEIPRTFADYRDLLASSRHDIIIVATPDHWHALPAIAAMRTGADVWLEKPVGVDVVEGEALVAAARKYDRVVQVNLQRRSNPVYAEARDRYLRSERMGAVGLVEAYCYLNNRPAEVMPEAEVPAHLDYERWTGPAPLLPYRAVIEEKGWRAFQEYGNGVVGDMGVHFFDLARWMLGLGWPESIRSTGGIRVDKVATATISDTQRSVFRYPGLDVSWEHRTWGLLQNRSRHWTDQWGVRFIGKGGTLNLTMLGYEFSPADGGPAEGFHLCSKTGDLENLDFSDWFGTYAETNRRHVTDFVRARYDRSRPVSDIEEGHISSACCQLANLALELDRPLAYDPKTRSVPGDAEATRRLARAYRRPWVHPDPTTV